MALTPVQLEYLIKDSVPNILQYISKGLVTFPDDFLKYRSHPKFKEIERKLSSIPSPEAIRLFDRILELEKTGKSAEELSSLLTTFVGRYDSDENLNDKVSYARQLLSSLTADIEDADWQAVDRNSIMSLLQHRHRYPASVHEAEIESLVWSLTDRSSEGAIERYLNEFPNGAHAVECRAIADARDLWIEISAPEHKPDLLTVSDYLLYEGGSPFRDDARLLFSQLKAMEFDKMRKRPAAYDIKFLKLMLQHGIFTRDELIREGVATDTTLDQIDNPPILPTLEQPEVSDPEIHEGATDVFLFGIPSSGKTCVLMGLLGADDFDYDNSVKDAGRYADDLYIYRSNKIAPESTKSNFVAQIPGVIRGRDRAGRLIKFPINLIEMSGEEFAMRIAHNAEQEVNFENMGTGATKLLTSKNRKVIFIVIDPTADGTIRIATTNADGSSKTMVVQQDTIIRKIINMLGHNKEVLRRTNAIHFIMTKADMLGEPHERDAEAVSRLKRLYMPSINRLREIGREFSLNTTTDNDPLVFTFSLGRFYVGNQMDYDPADSNKIMDSLKSMVQGEKPKSFFSAIKDSIN